MSAVPESSVTVKPSIRVTIARWLAIAAVGVLAYAYVAILIVWIYAAQTGRLPSNSDIERYARTGHGPWDHESDLNELVGHGMTAPFFCGNSRDCLSHRPPQDGYRWANRAVRIFDADSRVYSLLVD